MDEKEYIIWFEVFKKKMKTIIIATSEKEAKNCLRDKIIIHKIIEKVDDNKDIKDFMGNDETFNNLMDTFRMK